MAAAGRSGPQWLNSAMPNSTSLPPSSGYVSRKVSSLSVVPHLLALEPIDRPTEDLDFVTDDPTRISDAVAALIEGAGRTGGDSIRVGCSPDVSSSGFTGIEVVRLPMHCRLQSLLPPGVYGRGFRSAR